MAIHYSNNCSNCEHLLAGNMCEIHEVYVSGRFTCDKFDMKTEFQNSRSCSTCSKYDTSSCAHPEKASPEMLCRSWAPQV